MTKHEIVYVDNPDSGEKATANSETQKLSALARDSDTLLYEISSVFPFQLFPDKIIVDKGKVTIVRKDLLLKRMFPLLIEDIRTVKITRGIFLATLEFEVIGYEENPRPVTHLVPREATTAKNYIMGLVKAKRENIDLSKIPFSQIIYKLEEIGKATDEVEKLF